MKGERAAMFIHRKELCIGCRACQQACRERNDLPPGVFFLRIEAVESLTGEVSVSYRARTCMQCARAACIAACPNGAILRGTDGIVHINASECSGCGSCVHACPFGAMVMHEDRAAKCEQCTGSQPACAAACPAFCITVESK